MLISRIQLVVIALCLASACSEQGSGPDEWIGRWDGPEGTYLSLAKTEDGYALQIADLDGPQNYQATRDGDQLLFERNGQTESIRATDGVQTGMKWLLEKSDCLTIKPGEGFCRD